MSAAAALRWAAAPALVGVLALGLWEGAVRLLGVPSYVLPGPLAIASALRDDWPLLWPSALATLRIALSALLAAVAAGGLLGRSPSRSRGRWSAPCSPGRWCCR